MSNEDTLVFSFIELSAQEIEAKTGVFCNLMTGYVWKLSLKDKKLIVNVPHFSFQIAPLSKTKFRPVNTQINIEFEFEEQGQGQSLFMHLYAKGVKRATFEVLH